MNINNKSWIKLFDKYNILSKIREDGSYIISARQIKEFREPRLMTKFDHKVNLPQIFKEENLSILPISRGEYIISTFSAYKEFGELSSDKEYVTVPSHLQSLAPKFITNEAIALNFANACKIIADFVEDDGIMSTINGRMGSGSFDFNINTNCGRKKITVNNSQIEIDAAYEGVDCLSLFEAKTNLSDDFIIRQLYYPYRTWLNRITKPIKTIFLVFSNGIFNLYQYQFCHYLDYNSIELVKQKNYLIIENISLQDIVHILQNIQIVNEPKIPFPQADRMDRIINLIELLNEHEMTKQEITSRYEFDERQTNYYTDAGRYLNFIEKFNSSDGNITFKLSPLGNHIMQLSYKERQLEVIKQILSHRVFNLVLDLYLSNGTIPDKNIIVQIMENSHLNNVEAKSTYIRRSRTVTGWINWIISTIDDEN